jgi:hypothetical protein
MLELYVLITSLKLYVQGYFFDKATSITSCKITGKKFTENKVITALIVIVILKIEQ